MLINALLAGTCRRTDTGCMLSIVVPGDAEQQKLEICLEDSADGSGRMGMIIGVWSTSEPAKYEHGYVKSPQGDWCGPYYRD